MIGQGLRQAVVAAGWSADWVKDGGAASAAMADGGYACVLLDLGVPTLGGLEVLRRARPRGDLTPVVLLPARDALGDRVQGLDGGAVDYLPKPFQVDVLLARMRA